MNIKFSYTDPLQLSETLQKYDQFTRITQLETGEGSYSMAHKKSSCMAIAEISASKPLLYEGWGTTWSIDFNWITPTHQSNDHRKQSRALRERRYLVETFAAMQMRIGMT